MFDGAELESRSVTVSSDVVVTSQKNESRFRASLLWLDCSCTDCTVVR